MRALFFASKCVWQKHHTSVGRGFISRRFYANVTLTPTRDAEDVVPYNV